MLLPALFAQVPAIAAIEELTALPQGGDILVFMPSERDISDTLDGLQRFADSHLLLPLFGRLPAADQRKIFRPSHRRKIIVATYGDVEAARWLPTFPRRVRAKRAPAE